MSPNKKKNIALLVASIVLFIALIDGWQYGFFTLLRFAVFSLTAYVAWLSYEASKEQAVWFCCAIAVLFNPFIPIYLSRDIWVVIDFVIGSALLASIFLFKLPVINSLPEDNANSPNVSTD